MVILTWGHFDVMGWDEMALHLCSLPSKTIYSSHILRKTLEHFQLRDTLQNYGWILFKMSTQRETRKDRQRLEKTRRQKNIYEMWEDELYPKVVK